MRTAGQCEVAEAGRPDLPLLRVGTERLDLVFAPSRGGRLLSLALDGHELLWRNPDLVGEDLTAVLPVADWPVGEGGMSTWANVGGSKTWPAPQGWSGPHEWAGPPDPVLDSGPWTASWTTGDGSAVVVLTSADDPRTGLRVERRFAIAAHGTSFTELVTFTNTSCVPRTWSIWEVCQVDTAGGAGRPGAGAVVVVPHAGEPVELDLGSYEGEVRSTRTRGHDVLLPVGAGVAKRGFPGARGPVAYRDGSGRTLELSTVPAPAGTWPDGGSRVEVWLQRPTAQPIAELGDLHPSAHLVELEVLGPLTTLAPAQSTNLEVNWSIAHRTGS